MGIKEAWTTFRLARKRQRELTEAFAIIGVNFMHLDTWFNEQLVKEAVLADTATVVAKYTFLLESVMMWHGTPEFSDKLAARFVDLNRRELDRATADFAEAIKIDPLDHVIAEHTEAIERDPKNTRAYNDRGLAYFRKNDYARAIADFTEVIKIDPQNTAAFRNRCLAYYSSQDYDRAIADCDHLIGLNSQDAKLFYRRGLVYCAKGNSDNAIADFRKALSIDPNNQDAIDKLKALGETP